MNEIVRSWTGAVRPDTDWKMRYTNRVGGLLEQHKMITPPKNEASLMGEACRAVAEVLNACIATTSWDLTNAKALNAIAEGVRQHIETAEAGAHYAGKHDAAINEAVDRIIRDALNPEARTMPDIAVKIKTRFWKKLDALLEDAYPHIIEARAQEERHRLNPYHQPPQAHHRITIAAPVNKRLF